MCKEKDGEVRPAVVSRAVRGFMIISAFVLGTAGAGCQDTAAVPAPALSGAPMAPTSQAAQSSVPQPVAAPRFVYDPRRAFVASAILPEDPQCLESAKKLQNLALALINFEDTNRAFPRQASCAADGKPLLSWRVHILPFLSPEARKLHAEFHRDEPWDSEHNRQLIEGMPGEFQVPGIQLEPGRTCYVALVADNIGGDCTMVGSAGPKPDLNGAQGRRLADIEDGPDKTLMLVQVEAARSVVWTAPEDFAVTAETPETGLADIGGGYFLGAAVDAKVVKLPSGMDRKCFLHLFLCNDGMTVEPL